MRYEPTHLKRWKMPSNYFGAEWEGYYTFLGQHRESDCLTRSNFRVALKRLNGIAIEFEQQRQDIEESAVCAVRESHWAVGWVEWIAIHESNTEALKAADEMAAGLEDYGALCDEDWSELECEEADAYWKEISIKERIGYIRKSDGVSIFAARRDYVPSDDCGRIQEALLSC